MTKCFCDCCKREIKITSSVYRFRRDEGAVLTSGGIRWKTSMVTTQFGEICETCANKVSVFLRGGDHNENRAGD